MTFSRWLTLSVFTASVVAAWQFAQPEKPKPAQCIAAPTGNPFSNAAMIGEPKPRLEFVPPETRKISNEYFIQ